MSPAAQEDFTLALLVTACTTPHCASPYLRAQVSRAEDVVYLSWYEECFEFRWDVCGSVWNMQITNA